MDKVWWKGIFVYYCNLCIAYLYYIASCLALIFITVVYNSLWYLVLARIFKSNFSYLFSKRIPFSVLNESKWYLILLEFYKNRILRCKRVGLMQKSIISSLLNITDNNHLGGNAGVVGTIAHFYNGTIKPSLLIQSNYEHFLSKINQNH